MEASAIFMIGLLREATGAVHCHIGGYAVSIIVM